MTPKKFVNCLATIGWSMRRVADMLGVNEITARRWADGRYPVPEQVAQWLETLAATHHKNPPPNLASEG